MYLVNDKNTWLMSSQSHPWRLFFFKSTNRIIIKSPKKYKFLFITIIVIVKVLWLQEIKTKSTCSCKTEVCGKNKIKYIMGIYSFIKHIFIEHSLCSRNYAGCLIRLILRWVTSLTREINNIFEGKKEKIR